VGFERETRNALGGQERVLDGALDIGLRDREKLRQERIGAGGLPCTSLLGRALFVLFRVRVVIHSRAPFLRWVKSVGAKRPPLRTK
jgi:hypothetical protein